MLTRALWLAAALTADNLIKAKAAMVKVNLPGAGGLGVLTSNRRVRPGLRTGCSG